MSADYASGTSAPKADRRKRALVGNGRRSITAATTDVAAVMPSRLGVDI